MTIQQLQYIIAVEKFRSFAKAAVNCDITQPTLSMMIAKLEQELDVRIFDRTNKYVELTAIGYKIIKQATKTVMEAERIREIINETRDTLSGELRLSVGPSIAPYILPQFIKIYGAEYASVSLTIEEMRPESMFASLMAGGIDAAIAIGGNNRDGIYEIPLYNEPFWVYLADGRLGKPGAFNPDQLSHESMWIMKEAQCLRDSAFSFCKARETGKRIYEAGNIETLVRVVDANGGFTIIPEMHLPLLSDAQRENVRQLTGNCVSMRRISMYIRHDYVRERMINSVVSTIVKVVPAHIIDPYILKKGIRLR